MKVLTEEVVEKVYAQYKAVPFYTELAKKIPCHKDLIMKWFRMGSQLRRDLDFGKITEAELSPHQALVLRFCREIERAQWDIQADAMAVVRRGGRGWQARAWELEGRFWRIYGQAAKAKQEIKKLLLEIKRDQERERSRQKPAT